MSEPRAPDGGPGPRPLPPPADPGRRGWSGTYRVGRGGRGGLWLPMALIAVGVVALLDQLGLLWWVRWALLWPLLLIAVGVVLVFRRVR